jgi:hypothetical protein
MLLINIFIREKFSTIADTLNATATASLSEYTQTEEGKNFSPYTI